MVGKNRGSIIHRYRGESSARWVLSFRIVFMDFLPSQLYSEFAEPLELLEIILLIVSYGALCFEPGLLS